MSVSKFKKALLPTTLVVGGVTVGSMFAPIGLATAQTDDNSDSTTTTELDADQDAGNNARHEGRRGGRDGKGPKLGNGAVAEAFGMTPAELRDALGDDQSLADLATEQGVDLDALTQTFTDSATERLDAAVAEGKIDEADAAEKLTELTERVDTMLNSTRSELETERSERRAERQADHEERRAEAAATMEEVLGLPAAEIQEALKGGTTLAELAEQQDVSSEALVEALVADAMERVDERLAEGDIDEDRAADMTEGIQERVESLVENGRPEMGEREGHGKGRGMRGMSGMRGGPRGGADSAPSVEGDTVQSSLSA